MDTAIGHALFDTAIGWCAVAWNEAGVSAVQLPESDVAHTRQRIRAAAPGVAEATPSVVAGRAIRGMRALLQGESVDLTEIPLDLRGVPEFALRVYAVTQQIRPGRTLTYGQVADRLGDRGSARAVGGALGRNPVPLLVPCHRVVAAAGRPGGFSAYGGAASKLRILAIEQSGAGITLF
ncbi:methylated-DNA--[protein]-cysteine S-methyltransferase [Speluncibacter jeojiensis]|uniref:MGMT family protein n=1 Tax=Speluncibacter jeojiensis TaxID=2710754 RepID=A0A9X4RC51_9ACTN|nr:MGMT family protein [Rhodococcus sp. D2-41]MDG3013208.1 MGMT family protein [Corynebacteriales bacterium D3-21]